MIMLNFWIDKGELAMKNKFKVRDIVKSKVNEIYKGTYTIIKTNKTTCWVEVNVKEKGMIGGKMVILPQAVYKNVKYSILEKVND